MLHLAPAPASPRFQLGPVLTGSDYQQCQLFCIKEARDLPFWHQQGRLTACIGTPGGQVAPSGSCSSVDGPARGVAMGTSSNAPEAASITLRPPPDETEADALPFALDTETSLPTTTTSCTAPGACTCSSANFNAFVIWGFTVYSQACLRLGRPMQDA